MTKKKTQDLYPFLKKVVLFQNVSDQNLEVIGESLSIRKYPRGSEIIKEGESGNSIFFLFQGEVSVSKKMTLFTELREQSQIDKALIRLRDTDNAFFGEMALCGEGDVRSATVTAETDCMLGELTADKIQQMIRDYKDFGVPFYQNLAGLLANRLRKANRDVLKLATALTLALEE